MNDIEIRQAVALTLARMTTRVGDKDYQFLINYLLGISASGEAKEDSTVASINRAIKILKSHANLAIVKQGNICELDCWIAARHGVTVSSNACGGMFPVMKISDALRFFETGKVPERGYHDTSSNSIVTKYLFYKRNPQSLRSLSREDVEKLNLLHLMS